MRYKVYSNKNLYFEASIIKQKRWELKELSSPFRSLKNENKKKPGRKN